MSTKPPHNSYAVIPPGELRCVWMTAGILSYQLCDQAYECESCALDAAMRKHITAAGAAEQPPAAENGHLREYYHYDANHCWLKSLTDHIARVGIEPGLASVLLVPKAIVLPSVGQRVMKKQALVWFVVEAGTLPLTSPVDGEVIGRNTLALENPRELLVHPFDRGWLYDIAVEPESLEEAKLLDAAQATRSYAQDTLRMNELLRDALGKARPDVGSTLADGGKPLQDISDVIGPRKYFQILNQVYGSR